MPPFPGVLRVDEKPCDETAEGQPGVGHVAKETEA
jgi:hypothetical protein